MKGRERQLRSDEIPALAYLRYLTCTLLPEEYSRYVPSRHKAVRRYGIHPRSCTFVLQNHACTTVPGRERALYVRPYSIDKYLHQDSIQYGYSLRLGTLAGSRHGIVAFAQPGGMLPHCIVTHCSLYL